MATCDEENLTTLTEFAPLSSEVKPAGFFQKLFGRSGNDPPSKDTVDTYTSPPLSNQQQSAHDDHNDIAETPGEEPLGAKDVPELDSQTRTLTGVLKRLGTILDRRSQTPQAYKDSDFKQFWMPDNNCRECYECGDRFHTFRRRHHCRICGQIFCSRCCNQEVPGKIMGYTGYLRVCTYCCKVVLSYAQNSTDDLDSLSTDLQHLTDASQQQSSLSVSVSDLAGGVEAVGGVGMGASLLSTPVLKRKMSSRKASGIFDDEQRQLSSTDLPSPTSSINPFDITPQKEYCSIYNFLQERKLLTQDSAQLREIWQSILDPCDGLELQSHRLKLRTYANCIVGNELVDWLKAKDKVASRAQAVAIGQALIDADYLECITSTDQVFRDQYSLYRPAEGGLLQANNTSSTVSDAQAHQTPDSAEPEWFRQIRTNEDSSASLSTLTDVLMSSKASVLADDITANNATSSHQLSSHAKRNATDRSTSSYKVYPAKAAAADGVGATSTFAASTSSSRSAVESADGGVGGRSHAATKSLQGQDKMQAVTSKTNTPESLEGSGLSLTQDAALGTQNIADDLIKGALSVKQQQSTNGKDLIDGWQGVEQPREGNDKKLAFERISASQLEHLTHVTNQLLTSLHLSKKWREVVIKLVKHIPQVVQPDVKHEGDSMNIRNYVQIKKIAGNNPASTSVIFGVVCSKNVAHKEMKTFINKPRILLLRSPIEYQRVEKKYSSLEPQILQEHEYLKNCVGRIVALQPDIILVEKSVSRVAQQFLLEQGIVLAINVKPSVMNRVARFTQADIITSIDGLVSKTELGFCHNFSLKNYLFPDGTQKTLMFFDGCASHLGCTVLLRGGSMSELRRVKKLVLFLVYMAYHSRLETSFLMDEFAIPASLEESSPVSPLEECTDSIEQTCDKSSGKPANDEAVTASIDANPDICSASTKADINVPTDAQTKEHADNTPTKDTGIVKNSSAEHDSGSSQNGNKNSENKDAKHSKSSARTNDIITDFSDPLHSFQTLEKEDLKEEFYSNVPLHYVPPERNKAFKEHLDNVYLSISPFVHFDIPYLETEAAAKCMLKQYIVETFYSDAWSEERQTERLKSLSNGSATISTSSSRTNNDCDRGSRQLYVGTQVKHTQPHPFTTAHISENAKSASVQRLLADFRARGGQLTHSNTALSKQGKASNKYQTSHQDSKSTNAHTKNKLHNPHYYKVDCLDVLQHQRLAVLFLSFSYESSNIPNPCVHPWVVLMDFYGRNDVTLGSFLERYCFRELYRCPSETCDTPMVDHVRRFIHGNGCVQIILKKLDEEIRGQPNTILMWSWCRKCKHVSSVVPMSLETWLMSFAKYLELRFHATQYGRRSSDGKCTHSLHHDHYQYFGCKKIVASFRYIPITLKEIVIPPVLVDIDHVTTSYQDVVEDAKVLSFRGTGIFSCATEHLLRLRDSASQIDPTVPQTIAEYLNLLKNEKEQFRTRIDNFQRHLTEFAASPDENLHQQTGPNVVHGEIPTSHVTDVMDRLVALKVMVAEAVTNWNNRLGDLEQQQKRADKNRSPMISRGAKDHSSKASLSAYDTSQPWSAQPSPSSSITSAKPSPSSNSASICMSAVDTNNPVTTAGGGSAGGGGCEAEVGEDATFVIGSAYSKQEESSPSVTHTDGSYTEPEVMADAAQRNDDKMPATGTTATVQALLPSTGSNSSVVKGGVCGGDVIEDSRRQTQGGSADQLDEAISNADTTSDVFDAERQEVKGHQRSKSLGDSRRMNRSLSIPHDSSGGELDKLDKRPSVTVKTLFNLRSASGSCVIQSPFPAVQHHVHSANARVPVVIYDEEPSSIIAFTLGSEEYMNELRMLRLRAQADTQNTSVSTRRNKKGDGSAVGEGSEHANELGGRRSSMLSFLLGGTSASSNNVSNKDKHPSLNLATSSSSASLNSSPSASRKATGNTGSVPKLEVTAVKYVPQTDRNSMEESDDVSKFLTGSEQDKESTQEQQNAMHIELQFSDSSTKFYCRVYFAEQFVQLRKLIFPDGEDRYIRSLSRCFTWLARGGKSGSSFCKTQDDRFVLKQMSRLEVQSFLEFAPHYIQFCINGIKEQKPSCLAKILGVYRIGYKNSQTNTDLKQDLLVMENLFYKRRVNQIFDLKGSVRNRLVNTQGKKEADLVLLDENLLKISVDHPLYIRSHSKHTLQKAITSDTHFLSTQLVMDYSLLVGVDECSKELVVGIIDYIRTFTWDKKIEMVVKKTYAQLGGQGKMPTVVYPEMYRSRFLQAMDQYFLSVPDQWCGLASNLG